MTHDVHYLRAVAINNSLFAPTSLQDAIRRLGFVQADPIRSPATAQDLILRHRVKDYFAGGLDQKYSSLDLEEDYLYAYGFLPTENWRLLHPRKTDGLSAIEKKVLAVVRKNGAMHPRNLEEHCGTERVINAWGGYSKATTRALEHLHRRGLLRVVRREKGIRVYDAISKKHPAVPVDERSIRLVKLLASIFAPAPIRNLQKLPFSKPDACNVRAILSDLIASGELSVLEHDGIEYVVPAEILANPDNLTPAPPVVRFLAPFDPLVWDRDRFQRFWNWNYRFEAYTPVSKRVRGYYALPLLWRDDIIGWANVSSAGGVIDVQTGFVNRRPRETLFKVELENEVERMKRFLRL